MSDSEGERWPWWLVILIFVAVVAVQALLGWLMWLYLPSAEERSAFGDMFGGVNALFAGLAFAGIIVTILLQSRELALQRAELHLTRKELGRAATAQEQSEAALSEQVRIAQLVARLNAASALIDHYDHLITGLLDVKYAPSSQREREVRQGLKEMRANKAALQNDLFRVRNELIGAVQAEIVMQNPSQTFGAVAQVSDPKDERSN